MNIGLKRGRLWWIEPLMALAVIAGIVNSLIFLYKFQYLPQPFFYDSSDTWMDWFNTGRWAYSSHGYDVWRTVYPPLTFLFIRATSISKCYVDGNAYDLRYCDWTSVFILNACLIVNMILVGWIYYKNDKNTFIWRTVGAAFGLPMLVGWERGQIFLVCFSCFILANGPLIRRSWVRWIFAGLAVNFKVYLLSTLFAHLLRRRWVWFEGSLIATVVIYMLTLAIFGVGTPLEIIENIRSYTEVSTFVDSFIDIWTGATYSRILAFATSAGPVLPLVGSFKLELIATYIPIAVHTTQAVVLTACLATFLRPEVVSTYRALNLVTCLTLITYEAGDYSLQLIIFLTFLERWQGFPRIFAILCCYVLCIPADIFVDPLLWVLRGSFLAGPPVMYEFWIVYGPFIRPGVIIMITLAMSATTIATVWDDVRTQGWKGRKRARFDFQLFRNGGRVAETQAEVRSGVA